MPREQQSNHTGISAPGSTTHKSSSWIPDDMGNGSRSHHRVPIPNIFAWIWWAVILGSIMKRLMVAAFMVRPVRNEHCSFVIFPHTTNQWSILQGLFSFFGNFFAWGFRTSRRILSSLLLPQVSDTSFDLCWWTLFPKQLWEFEE